MPILSKALNKAVHTGPLWKGPSIDGVTFSMLSKFLCDRERFRLRYLEGWQTRDQFNHKIFYGEMWHCCEESFAKNAESNNNWKAALGEYTSSLVGRYPFSQENILHWSTICSLQFEAYTKYWSTHDDVVDRTPIFQEKVFKVPYKLPSGRTVILRGKYDAVDLIGRGKKQGTSLFETKTKGRIDEQQLQRQLVLDLQTMLYLTSLQEAGVKNLKGVRYNVIRRPLSPGNRGTIVRHKAKGTKPEETPESYYARLKSIIDGSGEDAPGPAYFFMRWNARVERHEIERFKRQVLTPLLETLCLWYDWVTSGDPWRDGNTLHSLMPFGVYNTAIEGTIGDLDDLIATGSTVGLERSEKLFNELQE